jgi:monofunctional biosynthetic peptidoglycan transglycosylase
VRAGKGFPVSRKSIRPRRKVKKRSFARVAKGVFLLLMLILLGSVALYGFYPDVSRLKTQNPRKTSFMEYREREWKAKGKRVAIQKQWVPLSRISPFLIKAVIIAEDDKFWRHDGFDIESIQRAIEKDVKQGKWKAGGSTISQQLAKNLYLTPSKNPVRKLKEAILTWRIERDVSKKRILELYLNVAEWGEGVFGAQAASHHHFGKDAISLGPLEAARLAAVLPNPRKYDANGESRYVERRAQLIYNIMVRRGIVIPEYEETMALPDPGPSQDTHDDQPVDRDEPSEEGAPPSNEDDI